MATILFLVLGCSKEGVLKEGRNGLFLNLDGAKVHRVTNQEWRVGRGSEKEYVSKGFLVHLKLPEFKEEELRLLLNRFGIDSFLIKIVRDQGPAINQTVGHYKIDLSVVTSNKGQLKAPRESQFRIYYAATSMSQRFLQFPCPAFDHRYFIDDVKIITNKTDLKSIVRSYRPYQGKGLGETSFIPQVFNGGESLSGHYKIMFALYSHKKRMLYTEFREIANSILIGREDKIRISSCDGFTIPERGSSPSLKDIKFK